MLIDLCLVAPLENGADMAFSPPLEVDPFLDDAVECKIDMEGFLRLMNEASPNIETFLDFESWKAPKSAQPGRHF